LDLEGADERSEKRFRQLIRPMKALLEYLLFIAVLSAPTAWGGEAGAASTEVDVMTFNVRYGTADDGPNRWELRREHLFDLIRERSPDVLGVQEAHGFQIEEIMARVPGYRLLGRKREGPHGEEHSSILYKPERFQVDGWGTFWLSDTPEKPSATWGNSTYRTCTWARFVDVQTGSGFYIYNTHLTGERNEREAQWKSTLLIIEHMADRKHPDPVVFTGDLNAPEDHQVIDYIKGGGRSAGAPAIRFVDSFRELHPDATEVRTRTNFQIGNTRGSKKVDYVFVEPGVKVLEAEIVRDSRDGRYPSDHFPVTAKLRLGATRE
jgi:endonuclease/exonuclease/phosphatase family metal-dependent hydrolase